MDLRDAGGCTDRIGVRCRGAVSCPRVLGPCDGSWQRVRGGSGRRREVCTLSWRLGVEPEGGGTVDRGWGGRRGGEARGDPVAGGSVKEEGSALEGVLGRPEGAGQLPGDLGAMGEGRARCQGC